MTTLAEEASEMVRLVGSGPCANECGRESARYELMGKPVPPLLCAVCQDEADEIREREERREAVERQLRVAGLSTAKFEAYSLDSYPEDAAGREAKRRALAWLNLPVPRPNLFVHGEVGRGKTGLAVGLLRKLIEDCARPQGVDGEGWTTVDARLVNYLDYLDEVKESYGGKKLPAHLAALERVPVLCIDDLGAERPTEWALEQTATLVERRYRDGRTTVVTSNYGPSALARRLGKEDEVIGQRIVSRLLEDARAIEVGGRDRRAAAKAA